MYTIQHRTCKIMTSIEADNKIYLDIYKQNPPHPAYIAGFIDGDGCIFIRKIKDGYQSGISLTQCRTNILQILRYHFGGSITTTSNRNNKVENIINCQGYIDKYNRRNQYNLIIRSNEYSIILEYVKENLVIKNIQIQSLHHFSKLVNKQDENFEKDKLFQLCKNANIQTNITSENLQRINNEYIAGIFDAEGCIYINLNCKKYYISITQKKYPVVLEQIKIYLGYGFITNENKYKIYNADDCLKFIQCIKNHLIVKYRQIISFETFLNTNEASVKLSMYEICNVEKHQFEIFTVLNQNNIGKEGYYNALQNRLNRENENKNKNENVIIVKKRQQEDSNTNIISRCIEKTKETKQKMSISIRNSKNGISDETILLVRKYIAERKTNIEIQQILNLPRHTVSRIKNNILVCRNETKPEKQNITKEQQNINKRKITLDEILIVIDKIYENESLVNILYYLSEERKNKHIHNSLSIDIIKNIKRSLTSHKLPFYKREVSQNVYEKYNKTMLEISK